MSNLIIEGSLTASSSLGNMTLRWKSFKSSMLPSICRTLGTACSQEQKLEQDEDKDQDAHSVALTQTGISISPRPTTARTGPAGLSGVAVPRGHDLVCEPRRPTRRRRLYVGEGQAKMEVSFQ